VQFFEGHNFAFAWHFKFVVENGEKLRQLQPSTIHWGQGRQHLCQQFMLKPFLKT
jgi:hypothetical protein